jgi:hypothetical protein
VLKPNVIVVHGIHTKDSATWMDSLVSAFQRAGYPARKWTYGDVSALTTRWKNPGRAERLAREIRPGDVVVGHSNGACLTWMAAELGAPMGGAVLLMPALDKDKVLAPHVNWVNLYTNAFDEAVPWAELLFRGGHPWGAQGRDGLTQRDSRYDRYRTELLLNMPAGHSAILGDPLWEDHIVMGVERRYGN